MDTMYQAHERNRQISWAHGHDVRQVCVITETCLVSFSSEGRTWVDRSYRKPDDGTKCVVWAVRFYSSDAVSFTDSTWHLVRHTFHPASFTRRTGLDCIRIAFTQQKDKQASKQANQPTNPSTTSEVQAGEAKCYNQTGTTQKEEC